MPFTSVLAEIETSGIEDESKVAVSAAPLGTVTGDQFDAVFQSPLTGEGRQVLLAAKAEPSAKSRNMVATKQISRPKGRDGKAHCSKNHLVACIVYIGFRLGSGRSDWPVCGF